MKKKYWTQKIGKTNNIIIMKDPYVYSEDDDLLLEYLFSKNLMLVERYIKSDIIDTSFNNIEKNHERQNP